MIRAQRSTWAGEQQALAARFPSAPAAWWAAAAPFASGEQVWGDQEEAATTFFVRRGMACRARVLPDGKRQILELLLPGEHAPASGTAARCGTFIAALQPSEVSRVPLADLRRASTGSQTLRDELDSAERRRTAMLDERIVSLGQRDARTRAAHFCCELMIRSGRREIGAESLRIRQSAIADLLGLSSVHIHRTLTLLRGMKLIELAGGRLKIVDYPALAALADFDEGYLS